MIQTLQILFLTGLLIACIHAESGIKEKVSILSTWVRRDILPADYHFIPPGRGLNSLHPAVEDLELAEIVILASVDGKLHGLHRTTGHTLWSMTDSPDSSQTSPSAFDSLVRTQHPSHENSDQEHFIIEPQSGEIYVLPPMASPSDPLERLQFSMQQLVEMSPFNFPGDEDRMFVGSKETSMMVLELETGKVKGTVNADKECFWDDERESAEEIDLDELDGTKPPKHKLQSPEIHIGRTDYHVRVHLRHRGVVQNLFYSAYGPNNIDRDKQSQWRRTPDNLYIQPLPNGQLLAFQTDDPEAAEDPSYDGMPIWGREFKHPIVAVFDVVKAPSRSNPLALLQPRPHLDHLFPRSSTGKPRAAHLLPQVTHVGLVGNSLYAMGHENFPLVVFDQNPPHAGIPEGETSASQICDQVQCLVGSRRIESSSQWYLPPLLDAVPNSLGLAEERVPLDHRIGAGGVNADVDNNDSRTVADDIGQERWGYGEASYGKWGMLGGAAVLLIALAMSFLGKRRAPASRINSSSKERSITAEAEKSVTESDQTLKPSPSSATPTIEMTTSPEPDLTPPTPKPETSAPHLPTPPPDPTGEPEDVDESDKEGPSDVPRRKGPRRRKRGKKKKNEPVGVGINLEEDEVTVKEVVDEIPVPLLPTTPAPVVVPPPPSSLLVSDTVLGFGSHGTVVYEGSLQGRAVAVKRLLQDFVTIAAREVELLQESDDHPNVIRYYYKESKDGFLYIALELCPASLADIVERPDAFSSIARVFDPKRALAQVAAGLRHLHMLKIVHRDIKPQNILVSRPKNGQHRMLISDFGLCKKLEVDQTSFLPTAHGAMAAGTVGWRAPEILRGEVKLDEQPMDPDDLSSRGSTASGRSSSSTGVQPTRLTRSVDVFALGCLFYYTLTGGCHPFGDRFEREGNILKGRMDLGGLEQFGEEGSEAAHLISTMLDQDAKARPDTTTCLIHPFFWTPARRLNFLQDASDRFEIMCRDPREVPLITLETGAFDVVGNDWHSRLDRVFVENLGKFRKYDGRSVQDLLRALRNKKHHYQDLPEHVKRHLGPLPEGFLGYFTRRFPNLFLHVHDVIWRCGLARESMFRSYFELSDP